MEPLTTSAMIGGITSYLAKKLGESESVQSFFQDFSDATIAWIRPLFLKEDGEETEPIKRLREKPASEARHKSVIAMLESEVEDEPSRAKDIQEIFSRMEQLDGGREVVTQVINSKNVVTGTITNRDGNVHVGDRN